MNKEIDTKLLEIVNFIKESSSYQNYCNCKEKLKQDYELNRLIETIKKYQKEIVNNKFKEKELESKIQECLNILNQDVLYNQYLGYLEEVNNYLNILENKLNKYFYDLFN